MPDKMGEQWIFSAASNDSAPVRNLADPFGRGYGRHGEVVGSMGTDLPYATTWVRNIPCKPGDDVEVQMEHRLTRRGTDVEANIVSIRAIGLLDLLLHCIDRPYDGILLVAPGGKPVSDMASGDYQCVTRRDWEGVPKTQH